MFTMDLQCPLLLLHAEMWAMDPLDPFLYAGVGE